MKTYLITGCAGFIGSNFVHYMLKKYPEILLVNLDKLTYAGNLENLKDVEGDPRHVFVPSRSRPPAFWSARAWTPRFTPASLPSTPCSPSAAVSVS